MSKINPGQTYDLKKVGKYWLIGAVGKSYKKCPVLENAKEVDISENFLIADDVLYEIQEDETGQVTLVVVDDAPVKGKRQNNEADLENLQQKATCTEGETSDNIAISVEKDITEKESSKQDNQTEEKQLELTASNRQITKPNDRAESPEATSFPVKIIYEKETPVENKDEKNSDAGESNASKLTNNFTASKSDVKSDHRQAIMDISTNKLETSSGGEPEEHTKVPTEKQHMYTEKGATTDGNGQNEHKESVSVQCLSNKSTEVAPEETQVEKTSKIDELEMGQTEDDYDSLDAGHTEETSLIEHVFAEEIADTNKGEASNIRKKIDVTDEIKLMNKMVWEVISARHQIKLGQLKATFLEFKYAGDTIYVTAARESNESEQQLRGLRNFIETFNNKEYEEVSVESADEVSRWCNEIENTLEDECCMYVPGEGKVIMYCNTYEECMKAKHLLLLKSGKIKPSGMGKSRRKIHSSSETESCQLEKPKDVRTLSEKAVTNKTEPYVLKVDSCMSLISSEPSLNNEIKCTKLEQTTEIKEKSNKANVEQNMPWVKDKGYGGSFTTNENLKIYIYQAGILSLNVDCIVSASNCKLQHGVGIAAVIAKGAGSDFIRESDEYIKQYGPIPIGHVCATTAGRLPYMCVIHAVGPAWSDYRPHTEVSVKLCETDLYNAVYSSFMEAEKRGAKSIAFPAISSGIFRVPDDLCAHLYTRAILDYSQKSVGFSSCLGEIHFIDMNMRILQKVYELFRAIKKPGCVAEYDRSKYVKHVVKAAPIKALHDESRAKSTPMNDLKEVTFSWSEDAKHVETYRTSENVRVYVYQANILKLSVDCIANACNDSLQHGGGVAASIARAAGRSLTEEGDEYIRKNGNIFTGGTCVTTAGNLPYHCVIHAVGPRWVDYRPFTTENVTRCEWDLYYAVYNCFLQAEKRNLRSIALPAISSAIFGVPEELCVNQYVKATVDYSKKSKGVRRVLSEIHFVDRNPAIVKKIQEAFQITLVEMKQYPYDRRKFTAHKTKEHQKY